jgi:hypothetical protein
MVVLVSGRFLFRASCLTPYMSPFVKSYRASIDKLLNLVFQAHVFIFDGLDSVLEDGLIHLQRERKPQGPRCLAMAPSSSRMQYREVTLTTLIERHIPVISAFFYPQENQGKDECPTL